MTENIQSIPGPSKPIRLSWLNTGRKFWLDVHVYIALSLGFVFVMLGLTGAFNVFYFELQEMGLPDVHKEAHAQSLPLNDIMRIVRAAHPQRQGAWNQHMPGDNRDYLWAAYAKSEEAADEFFAPLQFQIDPYTGKIVGENFWGRRTVWSLVYELHVTLMMGKMDAQVAKVIFNIICFLGVFFVYFGPVRAVSVVAQVRRNIFKRDVAAAQRRSIRVCRPDFMECRRFRAADFVRHGPDPLAAETQGKKVKRKQVKPTAVYGPRDLKEPADKK